MPRVVSVADSVAAKALSSRLKKENIGTEVLCGEGKYCCCFPAGCDTCVGAIVSLAGMMPVYRAILAGKDIALVKQGTLVAGGDVIMPLIKQSGVALLPG